MGNANGHQTTQTSTTNTTAISNVTQEALAECLTQASAEQTIMMENIDVAGDLNLENKQYMTVDSSCAINQTLDGSIANQMSNQVAQQASQQTMAGMQWMDNGSTDIANNINTHIESNLKQTTISNCKALADLKQNIIVSGAKVGGNANARNEQSMSMISDCVLGAAQRAAIATESANIVNQTASYAAESPLAFIGDMFGNLFATGKTVAVLVLVGVALFLVVSAILVGLKLVLTRGKSSAGLPIPSRGGHPLAW